MNNTYQYDTLISGLDIKIKDVDGYWNYGVISSITDETVMLRTGDTFRFIYLEDIEEFIYLQPCGKYRYYYIKTTNELYRIDRLDNCYLFDKDKKQWVEDSFDMIQNLLYADVIIELQYPFTNEETEEDANE